MVCDLAICLLNVVFVFQVSNKENEVNPPRKLAKKTKKIRNLYHVPTSFRFSGFLPTTKGSLSLAKAEMKSLYPLIQNVSFLGLRKGSEAMHGWANFANPTDCAETCEEVKKNPKNGLKVEKMGPTKPAEFEEIMKENVLPPPTKKPCRFDFTQNLNIENL